MAGMAVSDTELTALAVSHDIITLGMQADEVRRQRHGTRTTFVRVANVAAAAAEVPALAPAAGEIRIVGVPASRSAAVARVQAVVAGAKGIPVSGFSLADLEQLAARDGVTLRALLEELRAAGLELVAEAPFDRIQDARRSIEEVNIAGLALARLTIQQLPSADAPSLLRRVADLQRAVAVIRAFAPLPRAINPAVPTTGFDDVIPGYGEPFKGKERIEHFQTYLRDLWTQTTALHDRHVAAADAAKQIDMTSHKPHFPSISGPGVNPVAVSRMYAVIEHRADQQH